MTGPFRKTVYDPLKELMAHYAHQRAGKKEPQGPTGTVEERLRTRIVDGEKTGLQADLDDALTRYDALAIINSILLDGMKVVGELFGSGQMQLPFVLQSAEVMKAAVTYLEQFMDKAAARSKGTMVIATVKGDVHDIGKNLVDIILTNNGFRVINLGIKCPVEAMIRAAAEQKADAIGMSGLLVRSTLIMKENLGVLNEQGITIPVILGGAALTRRFVEQDLRPLYRGNVFYANDAFDGLRFMDQLATGAISESPAAPDTRGDREDTLTGTEAKIALAEREDERYATSPSDARAVKKLSGVRTDVPVPVPPFWGTRIVDDLPLDAIYPYINEVALFRGQWQVRKGSMSEEEYRALIQNTIVPEFETLKATARRERLLTPRVVYGYFPCQSDGDDLIIYREDRGTERLRFRFPRQTGDRRLCLADYFASVGSGRMDVVAFQLVTMGRNASEHSASLYAASKYRDYLYFHGLSVECAEALAEFWHRRIREELGIGDRDAAEIRRLFSQGYQGSRYSFGYPACPDLADQVKLFDLLDGERIGVRLTDGYSLDPEQSTNAIIVHHPEARYFNVESPRRR